LKLRTFDDFREFVKTNSGIKRCILRCDLNLPSSVKDLSRILAVKNTVSEILSFGLDVVLISHYKRPKPTDAFRPEFSLSSIVSNVADVLECDIQFVSSPIWETNPEHLTSRIAILENLRFYEGETANDSDFAQTLARFGEVYINDAFSVSHRKHASVCAITQYLPAFAGLSLQNELYWLSKLTHNIERPYTAIIGGSKVSTKIDVLKHISKVADHLIITGAMANTFLAARGFNLQNSLIEEASLSTANEITSAASAEIILPVDFLASMDIQTSGIECNLGSVPSGYSCFDIGRRSVDIIQQRLTTSRTLLWNGAIGAFEFANFSTATNSLTPYIANLSKTKELVTIIGGGETIASIGHYKDDMTFVSTAGGAFLEFTAGYKLPGITSLTV
jgi:phosphoglycerate kinase